ncbi:MAG: DUF945 family protein [Lautropia sp.]|nr:DUF945 family protein [Lautropia sp.]
MSKAIGLTAVSLIALGGAYTGGSWWLGQEVERQYNAHIDQLVAEYGFDKVKVQSRQYERGVFGAKADLVLAVTLPRPKPRVSEEEASDEEAAPQAVAESSKKGSAKSAKADRAEKARAGNAESRKRVALAERDAGKGASKTALNAGQKGAAPAAPAATDNAPQKEEPPIVLHVHLKHDITHGPLAGGKIAAAKFVTTLDHVDGLPMDEEMRQLTANLHAPVLTTVHGFNKSLSGNVMLPAGEIRDAKSAHNHLRWQKLDYGFDLNADRTRLGGTFNWPLVSMSIADRQQEDGTGGQGIVMEMRGSSGAYDMTLNRNLWLMSPGRYDGKMDLLDVQLVKQGASPSRLFSMHNVTMEGRNRQEGNLLSGQQKLSGRATIVDMPLENISVEGKVSRIDANVLAEMQKLVLSLMQNPEAASDVKDIEPDLLDMMGRLLAARPEISETISVKMAGKTGELKYAVSLKESAAEQMDVSMEQRFGSATVADASLRLPKAWASIIADVVNRPDFTKESLSILADSFAQQGFIKSDDEAWEATARFEDGGVSLNGKRMF